MTKRSGAGSAGAGGYKFQAGAGAYVVAHALSRTPLRWTAEWVGEPRALRKHRRPAERLLGSVRCARAPGSGGG
jgi:hypothetical protein